MGKKATKDKPKVRHLPVPITPMQVRVGDKIVTTTDKTGYVTGTFEVRSVALGDSCRNVHINDTGCYDRIATLRISIPEEEALQMMTGINREALGLLDIAEARKRLAQRGFDVEEVGA